MPPLTNEIKRQIKESGAQAVGVAVSDCVSRKGLLINPDLPFQPASTFKICVMLEIFRQAQTGLFSLEDTLPVKNEFHSIVDQSLFSLSACDDAENGLYPLIGSSLPIRELTTRMITHSSNLATNILMELVTPGKVTDFMHSLGAKGLLVRRGVYDHKAFALGLNNVATARSLTQILKKLALHRVVSPQASEEMLAILKRQHFNEGIPALLPAGLSIAHKTGWDGQIYHDAAIIYPPARPHYILTIMTSGLADDKEAPALVASLSKLIYDHQPEWR